MSVYDRQSLSADLVMPDERADAPEFGEVGTISDEFARLSETLARRARQVAALIERASAAEERCVALIQRQEDQDRVIAELREQLDQVNARVVEFQESGVRHLAELQAVTDDYARRVASSEQASEALQAWVAELTDLVEQRDNTIAETQTHFASQDALLAQFRQRADSAAATEALLAESLEAASQHLRQLMALDDETEQPREHNSVPPRTGWGMTTHEPPAPAPEPLAAAPPAPTAAASMPIDGTAREAAPTRGWYRRVRQSAG